MLRETVRNKLCNKVVDGLNSVIVILLTLLPQFQADYNSELLNRNVLNGKPTKLRGKQNIGKTETYCQNTNEAAPLLVKKKMWKFK